jgi:energy-coupling factor transporter ATP-binding protein EcfA2
MRLRYLHLPRCGPLTDTAVVFGREDLIGQTLNLPRKGSLNFVVGVNGSGKSSLLRALYRIFRALKKADWPDLPVSIAWDIEVDGTPLSIALHYSNAASEQPFIAVLKQVSRLATKSDWSSILHSLGSAASHPLSETLEVEIGAGSIQNPPRRFRLPKNMIAYSSGDDAPWRRLEHRDFNGKDEEEGQYQTEDERKF